MNYSIYIETGNWVLGTLKVRVNSFDSFEVAKKYFQNLIVNMIENYKNNDNGLWEQFKEESSNHFLTILESYEKKGCASEREILKENVEYEIKKEISSNYRYSIYRENKDKAFFIYDSTNRECLLSTNVLSIDGSQESYTFQLKHSQEDTESKELLRIKLVRETIEF